MADVVAEAVTEADCFFARFLFLSVCVSVVLLRGDTVVCVVLLYLDDSVCIMESIHRVQQVIKFYKSTL